MHSETHKITHNTPIRPAHIEMDTQRNMQGCKDVYLHGDAGILTSVCINGKAFSTVDKDSQSIMSLNLVKLSDCHGGVQNRCSFDL